MRKILAGFCILAFASGLEAAADNANNRDENNKVAVKDNCDPNDPAWLPVGCFISARIGNVTAMEFGLLLNSPLSLSVVGHPSWRMEPSFLTIDPGETVRVQNEGGRPHTFTEVNQFGGGRIPALNKGLTPAPECASAPTLAPGERGQVHPMTPGVHRFQCCIHPWMRAVIKVEPNKAEDK